MTGLAAVEYHERTKHTPRSLRDDDFRLDFENKPRPYKVYERLPAVSLGAGSSPEETTLRAVASSSSDGPDRDERPDRGTIASICHYSAGVTKTLTRGEREIEFRAAACTGALYHVDLYLVCGDLPGLDAGVYHYDPANEALDVLRRGEYREALSAATGDRATVAEAPATVVATSTWWRNAWKYRARAYRHAFWDSGTVLANLLAVARSFNRTAELVVGFADGAVADLLGVDPTREAPIALATVGGGDDCSPAPEVDPIDPETRPLSSRERRDELIEEAYAASTLPDGEAAAEWRDRGRESDVGTRPPADGRRVELAPVDDDRAFKTPLGHTIDRRGSCREYARDSLTFRKVSTVLDRATRGVPMDVRNRDGPRLAHVDAYLLVNDVSGVDPGAYHYHPGTGELELLREGEFRNEAGHLALDQRLAADAGLCVFFLSDVGSVTDRLGDRGYRAAQLEAAVTAGRLYLGAYAHSDLGATGLTFYDDEVTDFFEPRAAGQTPLFLWTLGRPA